ncbi:hypothetical protein [Streptomyces melanogenes]|uniref:hypothetical protein n=1 Tax=Streptomyces melanogenes TaxID=67326 RepID=UPI003797FC96
MTSVMGLLEERETAARVRAEELREESERVLAELAEAEVSAPVAGSVVQPWREGVSTDVLAADYRRIVDLVADETVDGEGVSAKDLAVRLGLEAVPAKVEGVRSKARRLAQRGWLEALPTGRFTPRPSTSPARPTAAQVPGGPGGGS